LESKFAEELESEVPELSTISPFGPLTQPTSRKTLYHLIATLNACFPDYDFRYIFLKILKIHSFFLEFFKKNKT